MSLNMYTQDNSKYENTYKCNSFKIQDQTRMHSSRMRTARSLIVSPYLVVSHACPPGATMHAPPRSNYACPPEQPCIPPQEQPRMPPPGATTHAPPEQPRMPPRSNHACPPGATTHAPGSNHAHPPGATMHAPPEQPCMPPSPPKQPRKQV